MDQSTLIDESEQSFEQSRRVEPTNRISYAQIKNYQVAIVHALKLSFIRDVQQNKMPFDSLPNIVQQKISDFEDEFQDLWKESDEFLRENGEAIEKLVMKPLCSKLISIDPVKDREIEFSMKAYSFVQAKHLEIDENIEKHKMFNQVVDLISKIDKVETPKEKLNCIVNAGKQTTIVNQMANNQPTGADNLLPVLIYATLKAQPQKAYSNILFVSYYRSPKRITGEDEYYFTTYESTLQFIEKLDYHKLNINHQEFQDLSKERLDTIKNSQNELSQNGVFNMDAHQNYVNLQMIKMKIQDLQRKSKFYEQSKKYKLKFNQKQLNNITLNEIPEFYEEYQNLYKNLMEMQKDIHNLYDLTNEIIKESQSETKKQATRKFFGIL
ncbi:unnamed protein product (macronuclear) [Paramecium tetraurelia]|uniref:VPS9 domain-containing protein n=1 Tax=Paramecium tetraurelia TaxID=5888 RepID=A0EH74_PARTE|nr:uncharacterized protein GSPATT00026989001 [Paramecium tetraurelia]CAK94665.1 unnamed protein product [Paramecium tetraurelia]|eukprot:XP_001462038.1 hypothetical protein (macronuclear) [Paramecium tetraurelia strain d4-2]